MLIPEYCALMLGSLYSMFMIEDQEAFGREIKELDYELANGLMALAANVAKTHELERVDEFVNSLKREISWRRMLEASRTVIGGLEDQGLDALEKEYTFCEQCGKAYDPAQRFFCVCRHGKLEFDSSSTEDEDDIPF